MDCFGGISILFFVVGLTEMRSAFRLASNEPKPCSDTTLLASSSFLSASAKPLNNESEVSASICSRAFISAMISFVFTVLVFFVYTIRSRYYEKFFIRKNFCIKALIFLPKSPPLNSTIIVQNSKLTSSNYRFIIHNSKYKIQNHLNSCSRMKSLSFWEKNSMSFFEYRTSVKTCARFSLPFSFTNFLFSCKASFPWNISSMRSGV